MRSCKKRIQFISPNESKSKHTALYVNKLKNHSNQAKIKMKFCYAWGIKRNRVKKECI